MPRLGYFTHANAVPGVRANVHPADLAARVSPPAGGDRPAHGVKCPLENGFRVQLRAQAVV